MQAEARAQLTSCFSADHELSSEPGFDTDSSSTSNELVTRPQRVRANDLGKTEASIFHYDYDPMDLDHGYTNPYSPSTEVIGNTSLPSATAEITSNNGYEPCSTPKQIVPSFSHPLAPTYRNPLLDSTCSRTFQACAMTLPNESPRYQSDRAKADESHA